MSDNEANSLQDYLYDHFMKLLEGQVKKASSQEEIDLIIEKFEKIDLSKVLVDTLDTIASDTTSYMHDTMYEQVIEFRAAEQEFLARQEQKWYKAFVASESMYIMTLESAETYREEVSQLPKDELKKHHNTFNAMLYIHGRAMQQFLEIITLMKNGFADGAYARWRSMYELAIISSFITQNGEKVAKSFINSAESEDRYEWARASNLFPKEKKYITFNDIQRKCDLNSDAWYQQYDLANKLVHASPQGTFNRLGIAPGQDEIISVGRSDYGITTPGEHSAISLAQITTIFYAIYNTENSVLAMKYIYNWIDVIREEYFQTHDFVFPDEEKMWNDDVSS